MRRVTLVTLAVLAVAATLTAGFLAHLFCRGARGQADLAWPILLAAWAVLPYAVLAALALVMNRSAGGRVAALIGSAAVVAFAAFAYVDGFFVHLDPQSALLVIVVPLWQLAGCAVTGFVSFALWIVRAR